MKVHPALWATIALWGSLAHATTYVVNNHGTGNFPTIQSAINAAASGDTVALIDGVFTRSGNRDISFLGKSVVLRSLSGNPAACVLDAQGSATDNHRVLDFTNSEGPNAVVDGVTVRGGYTPHLEPPNYSFGGGIYVGTNAGPTFQNCVITGNYCGDNGAGMAVATNAYPTLMDCVISGNSGGEGSGIGYDSRPDTTLVTAIRCLFQSNVAMAHGGGVALAGANHFTDCTFYQNQASQGAGFFICGGSHATTFSGCTFLRNRAYFATDSTATYGGGGMT